MIARRECPPNPAKLSLLPTPPPPPLLFPLFFPSFSFCRRESAGRAGLATVAVRWLLLLPFFPFFFPRRRNNSWWRSQSKPVSLPLPSPSSFFPSRCQRQVARRPSSRQPGKREKSVMPARGTSPCSSFLLFFFFFPPLFSLPFSKRTAEGRNPMHCSRARLSPSPSFLFFPPPSVHNRYSLI